MDRVGKCNYITWIQWLSGVRIIRNPWFSRVFTRKAKQLVPTLDPRAAATSAAMLEPWTWNCSASYATSCQVFLAMHVACGPSKSFQGGCGVIFKVPTVSRTPYPVGVLFLQGCSSTGIQWKYNETSTSPSSTKTIKIAQNPCYPLFKLFKSIQGPSKHFRDSGFHHVYVFYAKHTVKQTLSWIQEHGGSLAEEPPDFWRSRMLKCATAQYWGTEYLKNNEKL